MSFLESLLPINLIGSESMNLVMISKELDDGLSNSSLKIIFLTVQVVGFSAIIFYLWKLVVITRRLFYLFWASIEDED